jgi:hypothetical protein
VRADWHKYFNLRSDPELGLIARVTRCRSDFRNLPCKIKEISEEQYWEHLFPHLLAGVWQSGDGKIPHQSSKTPDPFGYSVRYLALRKTDGNPVMYLFSHGVTVTCCVLAMALWELRRNLNPAFSNA